MIAELKKGNKIYIKPSKRGSFTSWCGGKVTNECIRRGKNSSSSAIRKKATFAQNARRWSKHQQGGLIKAQLGTKFMDWIKNIVQAGAINENPSVMTASGWRYNSNGKVKQDTQNKEDVKQLRNNLSSLGEGALATQFAAQRKGKSAYQYTQENQDELNAARELDNIFEENSLKKYLDNFMSYGIPTITIGGTSYVGATNASKNK